MGRGRRKERGKQFLVLTQEMGAKTQGIILAR
jgi:hypothetical protein